MLQEKLQTPLRTFFITPFQFQGLPLLWGLCLANLALIFVLGGMMMLLSHRPEFLMMTLIMVGSAGSMVMLLLLNLQKLKLSTQKQDIESKAYEAVQTPLLILTSDLQFCYGNTNAQQACWWAESVPFLQKILINAESREALNRLIQSFEQRKPGVETLFFQGERGEEIWRIQTLPFLEKQALWQCTNVTQEREKNSHYVAQLNFLHLLLDYEDKGLFSLNENGIILFCNDKFADWLGYTRDRIEGVSLSKFLVKSKGPTPVKLTDIQGKVDFVSSSSRIKSAFLEQDLIQTPNGMITHSVVNIHASFASHGDLRRVLEIAPFPVIFLNENLNIQDANHLFREKFWAEDIPLHGASFLDRVVEAQREEIRNTFQRHLEGKNEGTAPLEIYLNDAKESIVSAYIVSMPIKNQKGLFIQFHDITEQKRFENQLVQSQKMQAVGQLAGGIAHDFNNLLTAMIGFCDLMLQRQTPGDQSFTDVMQIKQNATRATNLVRQLLAFSRPQTLEPHVLNITDTLSELYALLRRLLGANVDLKIKYARDLGLVLINKGHFDQVIMNVAVNARDAMVGGGTIVLTTQNCELKKPKRFNHLLIPAGMYVLLEIIDTGEGIKPEILDRIFDPFFSTKEVGEGTGLGLSTVYGIIKQAGGFVHVKSQLGEGTTFSIYLPHCSPEEALKIAPPTQEKPPLQDLTGSSTIMLVEDEDAVRLFSARALRSKGYTVIEAINGEEALEYMQTNTEKIDLVISDVIMPNMDGPTFVNKMNELREDQKVLFISGYAEDVFYNRIKNESQIRFLAKPFSLVDLATRVKEILNEPSLSSVQN